MKQKITRNEFLQKLSLLGITMLGGGALLSRCGGQQEEPAAEEESAAETMQQEDPCSDLSGLSDNDIQVRKNFEYVSKTPYPEKRCDNCSYWVEPEEGEPCGKCTIIKGPIHPAGYCTAWVEVKT